MTKNKSPHFKSLAEIVDFFDSRDLGDYFDELPDVHFEVDNQQRKHLFYLDNDISNKLTEIVKSKKVPSEILINTWLREN